eukprot:g7865.t1
MLDWVKSAAAIREQVDGKVILITGGTGSWGKKMLHMLLTEFDPAKVIVFSRDELKQSVMQEEYYPKYYDTLRFFLGDIRDYDRLCDAFRGVDVIFHAAALKQVPALEYNPFEAVKTNILGAHNVIRAARQCGVKRIVALSTDKAAAPVNLYGATKLCQDKLMVSANHMYQGDIMVSVVRYGNVFGSRGSVVPFFLKQKRVQSKLTITDNRMTRFTISLHEGVCFVLNVLARMKGGEIWIPKIPSYKITTVADAIKNGDDSTEIVETGIRPGEKLHEVMIPMDEAMNALEYEDCYVIGPAGDVWTNERAEHLEKDGAKQISDPNFEYSSGTNAQWLSREQLVAHMTGFAT